jgi:hypothetical protein
MVPVFSYPIVVYVNSLQDHLFPHDHHVYVLDSDFVCPVLVYGLSRP